MALTDKGKILDDEVKANQAQYNLDREAAKIFALSLGKLDKYKHLTGDDVVPKSESIEETKFKYSPLGKIYRGLKEDDNKNGFLKRLGNIEGKNEKQLKVIKDQGKNK